MTPNTSSRHSTRGSGMLPLIALAADAFGIGTNEFSLMGLPLENADSLLTIVFCAIQRLPACAAPMAQLAPPLPRPANFANLADRAANLKEPRFFSFDPEQVRVVLQRGGAIRYAARFTFAGATLEQIARQALGMQQLADALDDDVAIAQVARRLVTTICLVRPAPRKWVRATMMPSSTPTSRNA